MSDEMVLLSERTWKVVLVLFEMNVASAIGPPTRVVLYELPYSDAYK